MFLRRVIWLAWVLSLMGWSTFAQSPVILNYEGRISANGTNFNGQAFFVFSIHDPNGARLWSSGELPAVGSMIMPSGVRRFKVRDGVYQIRLGDGAAGMPAFEEHRLHLAGAPVLRVWFNDGTNGWQQLPDDTSLKAHLNPGNALMTVAQGEAILRELRELRSELQKQPASALPPTTTVNIGGSPSLGDERAPVVLVEFTDFQCAFCRQAQNELLPALKRKYVETGKLRVVARNLPLNFHTNAEPAAMAALCALQQNQYWPMRDRLFAMNARLSTMGYLRAAAELNLNTDIFAACLNGKAFSTQLDRDKADAAAAGITGTPTFVLGRANGDKVTGALIVGIKSLGYFEAEIEKLLVLDNNR